MKRTPLKRKTPMHRTGISRVSNRVCSKSSGPRVVKPRRALRRKSKRNSRLGVHEGLRREYCDRFENIVDEIVKYFPKRGLKRFVPLDENGGGMEVWGGQLANDPHHIFGGIKGQNHFDFDWNLAHVCRPVHEFCELFAFDGAVLSVTRKIEKGEWDLEEATKWLRFNPLGWFQERKCTFDWCESYRKQLVGGEGS